VQRRNGSACDALKRLSKIWRSRDISPCTKVKVYDTLILSILLYNSETWTLTGELNTRFRVFEMSCLRRIARVTRHDRVRNEVIRSNLKIKRDIVEKVELRRLSYFGHVARMNQNRFPYNAMHDRVNGCRKRGRPRKWWIDSVKKDCEARGLTLVGAERAAQDRHQWRTMLKRQSVLLYRQGAKRRRRRRFDKTTCRL